MEHSEAFISVVIFITLISIFAGTCVGKWAYYQTLYDTEGNTDNKALATKYQQVGILVLLSGILLSAPLGLYIDMLAIRGIDWTLTTMVISTIATPVLFGSGAYHYILAHYNVKNIGKTKSKTKSNTEK